MKNFTLNFTALTIALLIFTQSAFAADQCANIFTTESSRARSASVQEIYKAYPKMKESTDQIVQSIRALKFKPEKISTVKELSKRSYLRGPDDNFRRRPSRLTELQKASVVAVHNKLLNNVDFADYVRTLMEDCALFMAQNKAVLTTGYETTGGYTSGFRFPDKRIKVTKESYLENGLIDRHTIYKILVARARASGEKIALIHETGYDSANPTKTQKYDQFHDVPRRGPFFDLFFTANDEHGQSIHMLQVDYVRSTIAQSTRGQPKIFWNYVTDYKTIKMGSWGWDTFFDGFNKTLMEPEFVKPLLTDKIQIF